MGFAAIYKCNQCGAEFESREGGGMRFNLYRCIQCDNTESIPFYSEFVSNNETTSEKAARLKRRGKALKEMDKNRIIKCAKCGGELRDDIKPMCPQCKSRDVRFKKALMHYD